MKKIVLFALLLLTIIPVYAKKAPAPLPFELSPKREMRCAWVSTVFGIDWPKASASEASQKADLCRMLDSLQRCNFNSITFQVRSMCDAFYKSSYEPWSSYITGKRGKEPTYDPLAFAVSECHKRGLEIHAWINPYRFTLSTKWDTEKDQEAKKHLISSAKSTTLDPGQQWSIDRIVNVCREIVTNYDIDGIIYDDYFYPQKISSTSSAGDYQEWKNSGTDLSIGDWRRANVNKMVKAVYDMIKETKPWVRYGIAPAGVCCTSNDMAIKYGVPKCPSGCDWQYNEIFSEPLAWIQGHMIDYISPQVYWKIGTRYADYSKIVPWWYQTVKKFGRHAFISCNIERLSSTSEFSEFANEVTMNRNNAEDGQSGSVFWSVKNLYRKTGLSEQLCSYLRRTVYQHPALMPINSWRNKPQSSVLTVNDGRKNNNYLIWKRMNNMRYTVYAIPTGVPTSQFQRQQQYLLGMVYNPDEKSGNVVYNIPAEYRSGYYFAVAPLDRYGNEYQAAFIK